MNEFELIQHYFSQRQANQSGTDLGIGDDCALLSPRAGRQLAISSDMLVEGRHFFSGADARLLGHKALAVNLSDLAAMGAEPRAFTLALALPEVRADWLAGFSDGLFELADQHQCQLIGGDTTKGPLTICITVMGDIPNGTAIRRDQAKVGDDIWVSGTLGDARLALAGYLHQQVLSPADQAGCALRLHKPTPRVALGLGLRGIAHAAIDIYDGLVGDLGHILVGSELGATLYCDELPLGTVLAGQDRKRQLEYALSGGDDYELCFTAPKSHRTAVLNAASQAQSQVTRIGQMDSQSGLRFRDSNHALLDLTFHSFDHFS